MKNKKLLPIALLAALMLSACAGSGSSESSQGGSSQGGSETSESSGSDTGTTEESSEDSSPSEGTEDTSEQVQYDVNLLNIETIGEDLRVGDHRDLDIELTPEANVQLEINKGNLVITSSDPEVIAITGAAISALAEGEATISLAYHDVTLDVVLTVLPKLTPKVKYGTVHEGTAEDPFDNEDAVKVGHYIKDNGETTTAETDLYIKGVVTSFYHAPGSRDDGACSFYLQPATEGGEQFEIYKCYNEGENGKQIPLTTDDIWKGAEVLAHGPITFYNNQMETSYAWFDGVTGGDPKPADPVDISATFDEVMTVGNALTDGDSTYDYYVFDAYVVKKSGTNYFVYKSNEAEGLDDKALIELYNIKSEEQQALLLKGALVTIKMHVKNYHGQIENDGAVTLTVQTPGEDWPISYTSVTSEGALEAAKKLGDGKTSDKYYKVSGVVIEITSAYSEKYGNISFTMADTTDAEETLTAFRVTCTAEEAALVEAGVSVVVAGQLQNYVKDDVHTYEIVNAKFDSIGEDPVEVDYGTVENPLSVANLLEDDGTICPQEQGAFSAQKVVVLGKLAEATYSDQYGTYSGVLADTNDETKTIKFTGVKLSEDVAKQVAANDVVILTHYLEYYNSGYSLYYKKDASGNRDYGDFLVRVQEGTSAVTVEAEHATVNGLAETYTNDETATFTVTVEEGYDIVSVKAYGNALTPTTEGVYSFTVAGDVKVVVETKESGAVVTATSVTSANLVGYDGTADVGYANEEKTSNIDGVTWTYYEVGAYKNTGGALQMRKADSSKGYGASYMLSADLGQDVKSVDVKFNDAKTTKNGSNSLSIQFSTDGETWTDLQVVEIAADVTDAVTITVSEESVRYVKLQHTGNYAVYLDSVTVNF